MHLILTILIIAHGLIHLLGFLDSFEIVEFEQIEEYIPRHLGIIWLFTFLLFLVTGVMYFQNNEYWWLPGMLSIFISQALIFYFWDDSKFGTIPNVLILIMVIITYAQFNSNQVFDRESEGLINIEDRPAPKKYTVEDWADLPASVQKWLLRSGIEGQEEIQTVHITQSAKMKMEVDAETWTTALAEQYVQTISPSFVWKADVDMIPRISVRAKDKFVEGEGSMLIQAQSLITLDELTENKKLDTASLQRYLGEIVLYPSAALHRNIKWEAIDSLSAKATIRHKAILAEGIFSFNTDGDFVRFTTERYLDPKSDDDPIPWVIDATGYGDSKGWRIPTSFYVTWETETGPWQWLQLEITNVEYNL